MKEMLGDSLLRFVVLVVCIYLPIVAAVLIFGSYFEPPTPKEIEDTTFQYYAEQHPDAKPWETHQQETP